MKRKYLYTALGVATMLFVTVPASASQVSHQSERSNTSYPHNPVVIVMAVAGTINGALLPAGHNYIDWAVTNAQGIFIEGGHLLLSQEDVSQQHPAHWPKKLAEKINAQPNGKMEAGAIVGNSFFPQDSINGNQLWLPMAWVEEGWQATLSYKKVPVNSDWMLNYDGITTLSAEQNGPWAQRMCLHYSYPDSPEGEITVLDNLNNQETVYLWLESVAKEINARHSDIKAGEWQEGDIIKPMASSYRNKIWVNNPIVNVSALKTCE